MIPLPRRIIYLLLLILIIIAGLLSRSMTGTLTEIIDVKDVLWSMMVYFLIRIVFTGWSIRKVAIIGMLFSIFIEVSQLYRAEWIDNLRNSFLGQIILGSSFVWGDLIAYSCGIGLAILLDYLVISHSKQNPR